jgi:predicted phosphodiesterase
MNILLVGDTHGNSRWWNAHVRPTAERLGVDLICQLGDFGFWPGAELFFNAVAETSIPVAFLDGNHEHHIALREAASDIRDPVVVAPNLTYLPRGSRLDWGGVSVSVLGGAHSIDRALRTPMYDWFPREAVSEDDLAVFVERGPAQIMLTHDAPLSAPVPLSDPEELPASWYRELSACAEHRRLIEEAFDSVQPDLLVHGHYHVRYDANVQRHWGKARVVGLGRDGATLSSFALLTCTAGSFSFGWLDDQI